MGYDQTLAGAQVDFDETTFLQTIFTTPDETEIGNLVGVDFFKLTKR